MRRIEAVEARLRELEAERANLARYEDMRGFKNGTVLKFKYQYTEDGEFYTFAALKVTDRWFLTGSRNANYLTDEGFIEMLARANEIKGLKVATSWVGI